MDKDIIKFISPTRFDLMAKLLYIKSKEKNLNTNYFKELYHKHIITFNNCWEYPGTKTSIEDFYNNFDNLIDDMKKNGYNETHPIIIGNNGVLVNGAHRLMTSFYLQKKAAYIYENKNGTTAYHYNFFLKRKKNSPLDRKYTDRISLEYIKICKNLRSMVIYPVAYNVEKINHINQIISEYGYLYYSKTVNLTKNGVNNLIKEAYRGEAWIGGLFPRGVTEKARLCVGKNPTILFLIYMNDLSKLVELKEKCRVLFGLGKHSLHISDYTEDTFRIASSILNENSIHYLNNGNNDITPQTKQLLANYFKKVGEKREDYCLTSSLIMEMYHLRPAKDIDYLHKDNEILQLSKTGIHDGKWLTYYHINKDEIIYNPKYHFYFNGFKFATLEVIKKMKENRKEPKDINDILLINKFAI